MNFESWGRFPKPQGQKYQQVIRYTDSQSLNEVVSDKDSIICYGNGRSYGDSALNKRILYTRKRSLMLDFNEETGVLHCQAGLLLSEILDVFVTRGWFLPVTPGTKYITVGGAISSDVHGKNQQLVGSFSNFVYSLNLALADGTVRECSQTLNSELFKAVCGGMGLMGVIVDAHIQLKKIPSSYIEQSTLVTSNLQQTLDAFEYDDSFDYSVAWIDCLSSGKTMGRGVVNLGKHAPINKFDWKEKSFLSVPKYFPSFLLNRFSGKLFNSAYYQHNRTKNENQIVHMDQFFYPLDSINHWNRIYGNRGFLQYQFVIPKEQGFDCLSEILAAISKYGKGAYLGVLKLFAKGNDNYLSFPMPGYTLAVDFKVQAGLLDFLKNLDELVVRYKGRFYLAKDSRVSKQVFELGYPNISKFRQLRAEYGLSNKFQSYQSRRLAL